MKTQAYTYPYNYTGKMVNYDKIFTQVVAIKNCYSPESSGNYFLPLSSSFFSRRARSRAARGNIYLCITINRCLTIDHYVKLLRVLA